MPIFVNDEQVPEELVNAEFERLKQIPKWGASGANYEPEHPERLRSAAETSAINRVLIIQRARADTRPLMAGEVELELQRVRTQNRCSELPEEPELLRQIEMKLRYQRAVRDITGPLRKVTQEEVAHFYETHRENFLAPEAQHTSANGIVPSRSRM